MKELREHLGVVFQDSFLFRGTVWSNLAYGRDDTTVEEGLAKAKASGAHDFICNKPLAYETQLGERGSGLSGGEKQRLSIARTLLYDPKILVLDEATSNIDAEAEKSIQEALEVLIKGRTTVAIAHRLSTLRNTDRILVFDRGRMIEQGSHAELLDKEDGTYARLVKIQTQVSKDPNVDRLLTHSEETELQDEAPVEPEKDHSCREDLKWLEPDAVHFTLKDQQLRVEIGGESQRAFLIRAFPASQPDKYLSVRTWNEDGDDVELGMIRDLGEWSEKARAVLTQALNRRYLLRPILRIHEVRLSQGFLDFDIESISGRTQFIMRWTSGKATEFGENGKLIVDMEGNRYVVEDIGALPDADREKFLQYVYW